VVGEPETELPQIVDARRPSARLADSLHCRKKQPGEHPDDRDDHEEFDERDA